LVFNFDLARNIPLEDESNKRIRIFENANKAYLYDYIPIKDITYIYKPNKYSIYKYKGHQIHLFGEKHVDVGDITVKPENTIHYTKYITMLGKLLPGSKAYMELDAEVCSGITPPRTKEPSVFKIITDVLGKDFIICADKRYDLDMDSKKWFIAYKEIYTSIQEKRNGDVNLINSPAGINIEKQFDKEVDIIIKYLEKNRPDFVSRFIEYSKQHKEKHKNDMKQWFPKISLSEIDNYTILGYIITLCNIFATLYSPIMDYYILEEIYNIKNDMIIYVGNVHYDTYVKHIKTMDIENLYEAIEGKNYVLTENIDIVLDIKI
jgi:hypothetical protein